MKDEGGVLNSKQMSDVMLSGGEKLLNFWTP